MKYSLYVIELGPTASSDRKIVSDDDRHDGSKPCVYVGYTSKLVEERYAQHVAGGKLSSRAARKHGCVRLRPDLAGGKYALSKEKAELLERELAERLRRLGYGVSQA